MSTTSSPGRLRGHDLLCAVAEGTAGAVGDAFLRGLVRHVAEAFGAKMVMVAEASDPTGMHVEVIACWYDGAYLDEPFEYDTAGTPCAVTTEYPWVTFPEALAERFPDDETVVELGLQSYLAVCLKSSEGVHLGHLAVLDSRPMDADEQDATALRIFAARAGAELERRNQERRLAESRARVVEAADKERRRVGRDLHDGAQQRLLAVSNLLRVSQMKLAEDDPARALVAQAEEELAHAHAELRKLARGLHPVALRERGLGQALASLCQASDVPINVDVFEGELPLPVARGAYFVAAEALANAARYAEASRIDVRIAVEGEELAVEVRDDGVGGADASGGTGLLGLADRVDVLGGRLEVDSPRGGGTLVRAMISSHAATRHDDELFFSNSDEANALLVDDPFALLVGFALDQQVTVQKAFEGPLVLRERLGTLDPARVATAPLEDIFRQRPAIHRFPGSMARRVNDLAAHIAEQYDGDAARVWTEASSPEDLKARLTALPGFGEMKVKALGAVLAKRFGVELAEPLVPSHPTLGDVDSPEALAEYQAGKRAHKAAMRAAAQGA